MVKGNLWAVSKYNELVSLIKQSEGKFFILGITLTDTDKNIKIKIRKFIYYEISNDEEIKTINKLFSSEKFSITNNEYPLMFHICNYNNVIINIKNVSDEIMNKAFDAMKQHYDEDKERWIKYQESLRNEPEKEVKKKIKKEESIEPEEKKEATKEATKEAISEIKEKKEENNGVKENEPIEEKKEVIEKTQEEINEEKKRMIDKLICLKNKSNEYQLNFMSDIQKRKEEEENEKKANDEAEKERIKKIMKDKRNDKDKKK
jgi:hypothetical protein